MKVTKFEIGPIETNTYIIEENGVGAVVDPGYADTGLLEHIKRNNINIKYILLTHGHHDHIRGVDAVKKLAEAKNAKVVIGEKDADMLRTEKNLSSQMGFGDLELDEADVKVKEGDTLCLSDLEFTVIETPGHTEGGVSYYCQSEGMVFVGDTIFFQSIGRTDFPGGSMDAIADSILNKIYALPDDTTILTGHGFDTSVAHEKKKNPFFSV